MTVEGAAIILTHNRPELLRQTVEAIAPQVGLVVVIDNASDPAIDFEANPELLDALGETQCHIFTIPDQPPNLAALWQRGIDLLEERARYVAILCDDAPPPPGWYDAVVAGMKETGAVIGCSGGSRPGNWLKTEPDSDLGGRMPGHAFVLDLASGVRPDQQFWWWWCDTDLDFQGRKTGGMVTVSGYGVSNVRPNEYTYARPWSAERIHLDSTAFDAKWGFRPW